MGEKHINNLRLIHHDKGTQLYADSEFFGLQNVPKNAITMGVIESQAGHTVGFL
jgi:hypothetical protein